MTIPIGTPQTGFLKARSLAPKGFVWVCNLYRENAEEARAQLVAFYGDDVRFASPGYAREDGPLGETSYAVFLKHGRNLMEQRQPKRRETK